MNIPSNLQPTGANNTMTTQYNVRVYGIYMNDNDQVLVTDEFRLGRKMTKFPGGGNEFGEGLAETLEREWMEELSIKIRPHKLFYINDFHQSSAFNSSHQMLSVYYWVQPLESIPQALGENEKFGFEVLKEGAQIFRWIHLESISAEDFTFPIDQVVGHKLSLFHKN